MLRASGHPQVDGDMKLAGLTAPVKVLRDELGIPYIFAANTPDLLRAQGFVTAQHRLMQMELFRATWRGELAATFGADALPSDIRMRVLGMRRNGDRHALKLDRRPRASSCSTTRTASTPTSRSTPGEHPIELKAAGLVPTPWRVADLVTLVHFVHYTHSTNFKAEVVAQKLIDKLGLDKAQQIFPLTLNPDCGARPAPAGATARRVMTAPPGHRLEALVGGPGTLNHQGLGSNNWAVGPSRSASGKAMVVNDPHLDNRILPGTWHPVGLFAPGIQAVGAALPGMPGILVGRTQHVAFGVTNAYGDVQDLYIERLDPADPNRYLDGGRSLPFEVVDRDRSASRTRRPKAAFANSR